MRGFRRCSRILILWLLFVSVLVPIFLLSYRLKHIHRDASKDFVEDLSIIKHRTETQTLRAIEQEENKGLKEPPLVVYKDDSANSSVSDTKSGEVRFAAHGAVLSEINGWSASREDIKEDDQPRMQHYKLSVSRTKEESEIEKVLNSSIRETLTKRMLDEKVKEMEDQVLRARAYLSFIPPNSSSHLVKELKLRMKEIEGVISRSTKDSRLHRSAPRRMKAMDTSLTKARRAFPDCVGMIKKLRAMTHTAEEQVRVQSNQETFLRELGGRTISKGHHCLSMRLTADYFALEPEKRVFPVKDKIQNPRLHHFAILSDNILACSVVVNSTISTAKNPKRIVFHIVTDMINFPAMSMWFLSNTPKQATVHVESIENFQWLSAKYNATLQREDSIDPRYTSELNHLRFYLPDVFPFLSKIVLLDHDVVVQKDLTGLWRINMRGKVNGAVQTCKEGEPSFRRMDMFVNSTDPTIANKFDTKACTWAFGMNIFDLQEWRRHNLTGVYHKYLNLGRKKPLLKAGSLPIGWVTFYKHTLALDKSWHVLGLGYNSDLKQEDINRASVVHFDGIQKPWLDIGIEKYKNLWRKHVDYEHPYLQQCNVHQ